jgi:membrane-bound serine protease (ClpP class)
VLLSLMFLSITLSIIAIPIHAQTTHYVVTVNVNGEINYGTEYLIKEALDEAEKLDAPLIMILDTPGGLLASADDIIKYIRNSNVPVIGFVYPTGAQAWSAGTLILMATHIAAMAPGTLIGAAQPVLYDPTTGEYRPINESKIINPIVGIITSLAKDRGRNTTAAELFVKKNLYLTAEQALKYHVVEVIARSVDELLVKINGWNVTLDTGRVYILHTYGASVIRYGGSIRVYIVRALSDPIVNSLVATIGVLTLIFGILSGHYLVIPLAIGLIILSLIGAGFSINAVSLALLIIGAIALGIELFTPGFGILGFTGIILIALSIALLPILNPGWLVSPQYQATLFWTGASIGIGLGAFTGFIIYKVVRVKRQPPKLETIPLNRIGKALDDIGPDKPGFIIVNGEYWRAISDEEIKRGEQVIIIGKEGPLLKIRKAQHMGREG